jgi:hypothetical protein
MKQDLKADFEKFYEGSPSVYATTPEQIKMLMYGSYLAGYTLALKEELETLKRL